MKIHRIKAFLARHIYEIIASIDRKVDIFFWPTIELLTFGLLTRYIDTFSIKPGLATAILAGLILWTLVYNIQRDITVSLLEEAWSRNLYNLFSTPLRVSEVIAGTLILSVSKAIITVLFLAVLSFGLFDFNFFGLGLIAAFYVFNVFVFGWAFGYVTSFLIFRFGTRIQTVAWSLIAVIYPISGVFYPLSTLPPVLAALGKMFPLSYIFEGLRAIILNNQQPPTADLLTIAVLNLCYLAIGIWLFVYGFRHAKNRGWFIHPY